MKTKPIIGISTDFFEIEIKLPGNLVEASIGGTTTSKRRFFSLTARTPVKKRSISVLIENVSTFTDVGGVGGGRLESVTIASKGCGKD